MNRKRRWGQTEREEVNEQKEEGDKQRGKRRMNRKRRGDRQRGKR